MKQMTPFTWKDLLTIFKNEQPSLILRKMQEQGKLKDVLPEIAKLYGVAQPVQHHPEGHVFEHTMQVLDEMRKLTDDPKLLMAALCHDVGKGITPPELLPKHHHHEKNGVPISKAICERLGVPADVVNATLIGTENHGKFHKLFKMKAIKLVDFIVYHESSDLGVEGIAYLGLCDHRGRNASNRNHECFDMWFEMYGAIKNAPVNANERPDDTRKRLSVIIQDVRNKYLQQ